MKTRMQLLQDELDNDPYEQYAISAAKKAYYREKKKEQRHRIDRQYRGEKNEKLFSDYLDYLVESGYIPYAKWLSYHAKTEYDFMIQLKDASYVYIDVVGTQMRNTTVMLNCSHKDYKSKLKYLQPGERGYLAFILNGSWRFLQISRHLPRGDIFMGKGRNKHMKKPSYILKTYDIPDNYPNYEQNSIMKCARPSGNITQSEVF